MATMANPEHLKLLQQGAEKWNEWRRLNPEVKPDLSDANLSRADLSGASLYNADLSGANLRRANLIRANLSGSNLRRSDLFGTDLSAAYLSSANLTAADLSFADLSDADLSDADLSGALLGGANLTNTSVAEADFSKAVFSYTTLANINLTTAKNLELAIHRAPSSISIDTIYLSGSNIPEIFLRGAGVPEIFITYIPSLVGKGIEFYSCFISYSSHDEEFATRLHTDLQANGVRCWFAPHDIQGGRHLHEQIDEAIRLHDKTLLILSPHSMKSTWVQTETAKALSRETEEKRVLFPVRLVGHAAIEKWKLVDQHTRKDLAAEVRKYFIPDFSNWKDHDSYQLAFNRLLKDLNAKSPAPKA